LTVTGCSPVTEYSYLWSENNYTGKDLTNIAAGTYDVKVTDANSCSVQQSSEVSAENETCLVMNDAFSPNADGHNDVWNIGNTSLYPNMEVTIYNRWGQSVWSSGQGYPVPWDGTFNGADLPIDSYHYIIDLHNGSKPILGDVTIVR
jgi:gliding motility-associated-like protein